MERAFFWFKEAAKQNNVRAQFKLACAYDQGEVVQMSKTLAVFWYQKAADQSYVPAMINLAYCHEVGSGTLLNLERAAEWYQKAALLGDPHACNHLARVVSLIIVTGNGIRNGSHIALSAI